MCSFILLLKLIGNGPLSILSPDNIFLTLGILNYDVIMVNMSVNIGGFLILVKTC